MSQTKMMVLEYEGPDPMGALKAAMGVKQIPCISLWQPWAWLWVKGEKRFETRSWPTNRRGWVAVHAAKRWGSEQRRVCDGHHAGFDSVLKMYGIDDPAHQLAFGAVIGFVHISRCITTRQALGENLPYTEKCFGDFSDGRYAWDADKRILLPDPVPARGFQGFWHWDLPRHLEGLLA